MSGAGGDFENEIGHTRRAEHGYIGLTERSIQAILIALAVGVAAELVIP